MVGTNFMAQLLVGATPDSLQPTTAAPARFRPPGTMFPGMWVGYDIGLPDATPGTRLVMQVRVWDSNYGDFDQASMFNQAGLLPVFEWGAPSVGGPSADHRMFNFVGGIPIPVPEPTPAWLLVSIAPMAFLLLRRAHGHKLGAGRGPTIVRFVARRVKSIAAPGRRH